MHWGLNVPRERISSRAVWHRLDELHQVVPQHGCIPAKPASVSPGEVIVVGFEECASCELDDDPSPTTAFWSKWPGENIPAVSWLRLSFGGPKLLSLIPPCLSLFECPLGLPYASIRHEVRRPPWARERFPWTVLGRLGPGSGVVVAGFPYRSSFEESVDGGYSFGLPCSSTTNDFEPGGNTCSDLKNSMRSFCRSGCKASNANRWEIPSPLCASTASLAVVNFP